MIRRINILQCKVQTNSFGLSICFSTCSNCPNAYFQSQDVKNWNAGIHSLAMIVQTNAIVVWSSVTINTDVNLKVYKIMMRQMLFCDIRFVF